MSNTNYDVELPIDYSSYNVNYKHYIPSYKVAVPYYLYASDHYGRDYSEAYYYVFVSFDEDSEEELYYYWQVFQLDQYPPDPLWNVDATGAMSGKTKYISATGVRSKIYFRNHFRDRITFNSSNCHVEAIPLSKAAFEIKLNSTGYIGPLNASFKCSTVEKNIPVQYEWTAATVYYKKTTDPTYNSTPGTISGTWSDITVSTNLSLATGYTYNIYISAVADDGTTANTAVGEFATTDSEPVTRCIAPSGVYTNEIIDFSWSHSTSYGTSQYAYDLQYSSNNGATWTTVASHEVSSSTNRTVTIPTAGIYVWRVRTYNTLDQSGPWATASFINSTPADPPSNLIVTTKGRPTVTWVSTIQTAYQVQVLLNNDIVYDSGAVYTSANTHFINDYFDDTRSYTVRVRVYNTLGTISSWVSTGYQQPSVPDVAFSITQNETGGAVITIEPSGDFQKYYLKRNGNLIAEIVDGVYIDQFAIGITNYSVVGVTNADQSDIKSNGFKVSHPHAAITTLDGAQYLVNKRTNNALEIQTVNDADVSIAKYIGDSIPVHYFNKMKVKQITVTFFDDYNVADELLGTVVFYADNFGNGGYCIVKNYDRIENFVKNSAGIYANEVNMTLELTNYDDSIKYPL